MPERLTARELMARLGGQAGVVQAPQEKPEPRSLARDFKDLRERLTETQEGFSGEGLKDFGFRADFSRMDSPEERQNFLTRQVGPNGFTQDRFGNYALTPAGQESLGLEPLDENLLIEDVGVSTIFDIADIRGDLPAIAGGALMGIATGGAGFIPGIAATALGAAGLKGVDEAADALRGDNQQTPGEIAKDIAGEAAFSAAGEAFARPVLAAGRKLLAPSAKNFDESARALAQDAKDLGVIPRASQLTRSRILGRAQGLTANIFGDINEFKNISALKKNMQELSEAAGQKISSRTQLGELIQNDIIKARKEFAVDSGAMYQVFDDLVGGNAVIPTAPLKAAAEDILGQFTRTVDGKLAGGSAATLDEISKFTQLPDFITGHQMQNLRSRLYDARRVKDLVPGIDARNAARLADAADSSFTSANSPANLALSLARHVDLPPGQVMDSEFFTGGAAQAIVDTGIEALRRADKFYAEGIKQFDNSIVNRITKEAITGSGAIDPEMVMDAIFKKGRVANINRVMKLLPDETKSNVRRAAMEHVLETAIDRGGDPLEAVISGAPLRRSLDRFGADTLEAMFGKELADDLDKFARVLNLVTTQQQALSGGLVAASVALNPIQNLGTLAKLRVLAKVINSENGVKWLTEGIEVPNIRKGGAALARLTAQVQALAEDELQQDFIEDMEQ